MNRLQAELQRLYGPPEPPAGSRPVRLLVLGVTGRSAWDALGAAWRGVQADLDLPAPAIAVDGAAGFQLWFGLAEPVPVADASAFLAHLQQRYLGDVPPARVRLQPTEGAAAAADNPPTAWPPREVAAEQWSAFVAPDLASLFADTPWLDHPPGIDAQAEQLARLRPIARADWLRVLAALDAGRSPAVTGAGKGPRAPKSTLLAGMGPAAQPPAGAKGQEPAAPPRQAAPGGPDAHSAASEARAFVLSVMRDPAVDLALRLQAAKALLAPASQEPER